MEGGEANTLRAIETSYRGARFRSRLEARWAVFFDALGVQWQYEHEGFELTSGRYLPDFWLPEQKRWVEVKGRWPSEKEITSAVELAAATGSGVFIAWGDLRDHREYEWGSAGHISLTSGASSNSPQDRYNWAECSQCGYCDIASADPPTPLVCGHSPARPPFPHEDGTQRLDDSYDAALSARFEFGDVRTFGRPKCHICDRLSCADICVECTALSMEDGLQQLAEEGVEVLLDGDEFRVSGPVTKDTGWLIKALHEFGYGFQRTYRRISEVEAKPK